jgi:hypothetical protein
MGQSFDKSLKKLGKKELRVLLVGLDGAGKTCIFLHSKQFVINEITKSTSSHNFVFVVRNPNFFFYSPFSAILYRMNIGTMVHTIPTVGFNSEEGESYLFTSHFYEISNLYFSFKETCLIFL